MTIHRSEGIILQITPFRDYDRIISVFSKDRGRLSLFKKHQKNVSNISPLTQVEFTYFVGKSDLYTCQELSVVSHFLSLRKDLTTLESACEMLKFLKQILVPEKNIPYLFDQFTHLLRVLGQIQDPKTAVSWFQLLLLEHEGLFHLSTHCNKCGAALNSQHLIRGESTCVKCAFNAGVPLSEQEFLQMNTLAHTTDLLKLQSIDVSLQNKIKYLFQQLLDL